MYYGTARPLLIRDAECRGGREEAHGGRKCVTLGLVRADVGGIGHLILSTTELSRSPRHFSNRVALASENHGEQRAVQRVRRHRAVTRDIVSDSGLFHNGRSTLLPRGLVVDHLENDARSLC